MKLMQEFRDFINRGNVIDLAVGIVIGLAFTAIVTSLVNDVIMPIVGIIIGGVDFTGLSITVGTAAIKYGNFIQAVVNFFIIAFTVFMIIRVINSFHKKEKPAPTPIEPSADVKLLTEIRDLLKAQQSSRRTA